MGASSRCAGAVWRWTGFCPRGDDPSTDDNAEYALQVVVNTGDAAALGGTVDFFFDGQTTAVSLAANGFDASAADCKSTWESLDNVASATCFNGTVDGTTASKTWTVKLVFSDATMNNLHSHAGNPSIDSFACNLYVWGRRHTSLLARWLWG